jgi:uncharacterized protein YndB with AHSA1/START domain
MTISNSVATAELVTREVRSGTRNGLPTKIVVASRTYGTEQSDLWDAVTNPERIPRWFLPVSGELVLGGRYQLESNAGGVIERCEAPELFAVTWEFGGHVSWLQVELKPALNGTTLQLSHEAPIDDPSFWNQYGPGATGVGWDLGLIGLGLHLDRDAPMDPDFNAEWSTTPEGIEFVRHSATGWAEAAVADGEEPGPAHEAAERTIAFYTIPPDATEPGA